MDEERRTSLNLHVSGDRSGAQSRGVHQYGFLDRTGDEMHLVMEVWPDAA